MKDFQTRLDRYGADLDQWPAADAAEARRLLLVSPDARRQHRELADLEQRIAESRPEIDPAAIRRVINRSELAIRQMNLKPSWIDRLTSLLAAPVPRMAFAMGLTAFGFALGFALGTPDDAANAHTSPLMTASADDGVF
jgi:hypothetical protein